jgi:hypothetical protein
MIRPKWVFTCGIGLIIIFPVPCFSAQEVDPESSKIAFKITPSYYASSDGNDASDVNLRGTLGAHTAWIGFYQDRAHYQQTRIGYDYRHDYGFFRPVLSAQLASGGFLGGSATAEIGGDTYAIAGLGRTNLRPYYNLNFDPNDAITLGIGSRLLEKKELSLFHIWDDRLGTRQHVTHAVLGYKPTEAESWTVDASYKHGIADNGDYVKGYALSVYYGFGNYFTKIVLDEDANFSVNSQTRFSLGLRF